MARRATLGRCLLNSRAPDVEAEMGEWCKLLDGNENTVNEEPKAKPKGITPAVVANAADLVNYQDGSIVSRVIAKAATGNVTIFAFDAGQGLSEHTVPYEALVHLLDGEANITVAGETHRVQSGQVLLLPANQPHAVEATKRFKMILTMIRS